MLDLPYRTHFHFETIIIIVLGVQIWQFLVLHQYLNTTIQEEMVGDLLHHLDAHKSMGQDEIHPRALSELMDVLTKPILSSFISSPG